MKVNTMHAKIVADHSEVYKTLFQYSNIKDGDSILLITLGHPVYYLKLKKEYPNSLILNIEDVNFRFLWTNYLLNVELVNTEDIESLTKFFKERKMKFDHIIANPPYEFGNAITTTVLNNVDFDDYVNLMPVSKYKNIFQHIIPNSLEPVKWDEIGVRIQIAKLQKKADKSITKEDFKVWCYDKKFEKYFSENFKRVEPWKRSGGCINVSVKDKWLNKVQKDGISQKTSVLFMTRSIKGGKIGNVNAAYKWNISNELNENNIADSYTDQWLKCWIALFETEAEKKNYMKWSGSSLLYQMLCHSTHAEAEPPFNILPRINWKKEWTDEEILKDYGYSDEEIKELLK